MEQICVKKELLDEMILFRRWMHKNPELSEEEFNTSKEICKILRKCGIEYEKQVDGNGVVAIVKGKGQGKTVAAKADMDALPIEEKVNCPFKSSKPGVMHGCGHDANTSILLGTAIMLKSMEDNISGNIKFFFEPAEETIGGGEALVRDGCMKNSDVDKVIGIHVMPYLDVGKVEVKKGCLNASSNEVEITIRGRGGHAAEPHTCVDPIVIMSHVITALQTFISRNTSPTQSSVLTFGLINGGTKGNIIPDTVFAKGTLRTLYPEQREYAKKRVREIAEGVAKGLGAVAEVRLIDSYDAVINDDELIDVITKVSRQINGEDSVVFKQEPSMGAEDFSSYTRNAKGAYFHIGCKDIHENEICNIHTEEFHLDEACIKHGIEIQTSVLLNLLE